MIVSKANLQVVHATKVDKNIPALDNVHIAEDGSTVGVGGKMMLAVSPVQKEVKKKLANVLNESGGGNVSVSSETVRTVMRAIPTDKQFHGLLEHCNVEPLEGGEARVTMTDGKRRRNITGKLYPRDFLPWRKLMREASKVGEQGDSLRLVLNLKRLLLLLQTIEKVAPDTSGDNPVWIEFTDNGYIIIRAVNMINGQRCVGVMSPYEGVEGKWLENGDWERSFLEDPPKKVLKTKKIKHKKVLKHKKKIR